MATFESYINQLKNSFMGEVPLRGKESESMEALFSVLALTLTNKGFFSDTEVMLAHDNEVAHERDDNDAFNALRNSKTKFTVGSWRVYSKNYGVQGNIATSEDAIINGRKLQVRLMESWLGDRNGEVLEKRRQLRSLLSTQRHMAETVRSSFKAIDRRDAAMRRISDLERGLEFMPIERINLELQEVTSTTGLVRAFSKGTIRTLTEVDVVQTLGGYDSVVVRNDVGRVVYNSVLSSMSSADNLLKLPQVVERAHSHFADNRH